MKIDVLVAALILAIAIVAGVLIHSDNTRFQVVTSQRLGMMWDQKTGDMWMVIGGVKIPVPLEDNE